MHYSLVIATFGFLLCGKMLIICYTGSYGKMVSRWQSPNHPNGHRIRSVETRRIQKQSLGNVQSWRTASRYRSE